MNTYYPRKAAVAKGITVSFDVIELVDVHFELVIDIVQQPLLLAARGRCHRGHRVAVLIGSCAQRSPHFVPVT